MASSADNSTALQVMKDANADFLAFITNLRAFLTGQDPVTFDIGTGITVNSMLKLIDDYRNGKFQEIYLGNPNSGIYVKLSVGTDGNLYISDANGNLAYVNCDKIYASLIENCTAYSVTAEEARITSVNGKVAVSGGNVNLSSLTLNRLKANTFNSNNMNVQSMVVGSAFQCDGILSYGTRKFTPKSTRKMFVRSGSPLNDAADLLAFTTVDEHKIWDMTDPSKLQAEDLGFTEAMLLPEIPDVIEICGENAYGDFKTGGFFRRPYGCPYNVYAMFSRDGSDSSFNGLHLSEDYELAALFAWASGKVSTMSDGKTLVLTSFSAKDSGREIYYKTGPHFWRIYRIMRVTYSATNSNNPVSVEFDGLTKIPAYSCIRFIIGRHDSKSELPNQSPRTITYSLEFA